MEAVANIDTSGIHPALRETHFMVACDVANPFYGPDGAAYIFAQQKKEPIQIWYKDWMKACNH